MTNLSMSMFANKADYWEARAKEAEAQRDEFECLLREDNRLEVLERYKKGLEYYADSNLFDGGAYARIVLGRR